MTIECVVFDIGNVIIPFNKEAIYDYVESCSDVGVDRFAKLNSDTFIAGSVLSLNEQFQIGKLSIDEYIQALITRLDGQVTEPVIREAWKRSLGKEDKDILELIKDLKPKVTLACCSNTHALHWEWLEQNLESLNHISIKVASHLVGAAKPDPVIYNSVIEQAGCAPEACLFIDDLKQNVEGAKALGWVAHHYQGVAGLKHCFQEHHLI